MEQLGKFLDMGGYAGFVWPSYVAVFALLAVLLWLSLRGLRGAERARGAAARAAGHLLTTFLKTQFTTPFLHS